MPLPKQLEILGQERFLERGERRIRRTSQRLVAFFHHGQGIEVTAQEAVNTVFFNAFIWSPGRGAFAAQTPAHLMDRDVKPLLPSRLTG